LFLEKVPYFTLAVAASIVTFVVQQRGGNVAAIEKLSFAARGGNALVSYCRYLEKSFWPTDLAVFYPYPEYWPIHMVLLAGGLILGISGLLFVQRRRYPFLLMGWLWYCGTLVPVIGLVQVGDQALADRYTYIPSLGVLVLAVWGAYELIRIWRHGAMAFSLAGSAAIVLCLLLTRQQLGNWRDSETLFRHALESTENNYVAHNNLGIALLNKGQLDEAIRQYQEVVRLTPDSPEAHYNLGIGLGRKGKIDEAISQYEEAIRLKSDYVEPHNNLGNALLSKGQIDEAIRQFQEAIRLQPDSPEAHYNLGTGLGRKGKIDEAIRQYEEAIRLKSDYAEPHNNLGTCLAMKGNIDEAIRQFQEAVRLTPDYTDAHNNLGVCLAMKGKIDEAIRQFQEAIRLKPDYADARDNLARALGKKKPSAGR
jgi:tetratricopeptide (TPR) repeat protein